MVGEGESDLARAEDDLKGRSGAHRRSFRAPALAFWCSPESVLMPTGTVDVIMTKSKSPMLTWAGWRADGCLCTRVTPS